MAAKSKLYTRKRNKDGSYDSICMTCFATVGGSAADGQLQHEKFHVCDSAFLAERGLLTQMKSRKRPAATLPHADAA
jgi:hypothetical protein